MQAIEKAGQYQYETEFGWVTPTIGGKMCAYGFVDKQGHIKCGFEAAYYDGKIAWKKTDQLPLVPN